MIVTETTARGLHRGLGRADVVALTVNNIVGAGIFTMPAALAADAGDRSLAILLLTFALVSLMALCTVEVASRYESTGGPVIYARAAFGPAAGFVVGWLMYLSRLSAFGAIAAVMLDYGSGMWPALGGTAVRTFTITMFIGTLAAINLRGVVRGARASNILTTLKMVPLVLLAFAGAWFARQTSVPLPPQGPSEFGGAVLIAFFACMGFEQAAVIAGEVRDPRRDLPVGILGGVAVVGALYTLVMYACFRTVPDLAHSSRPLADSAAVMVGRSGATLVALTAVLSCAGSLSVWMIVSPRVLYALGEQGDLPRAFARVNPIHHTPAAAIVTSALVVWLLTISGTFVYLATFSAMARLLMYASICAALITLRRRDGPAPITIPLGPLWSVVALLSSALVLGTTTVNAIRDMLIAIGLGWALRTAVKHPNQNDQRRVVDEV
jgi:amino acid transporter